MLNTVYNGFVYYHTFDIVKLYQQRCTFIKLLNWLSAMIFKLVKMCLCSINAMKVENKTITNVKGIQYYINKVSHTLTLAVGY